MTTREQTLRLNLKDIYKIYTLPGDVLAPISDLYIEYFFTQHSIQLTIMNYICLKAKLKGID